MSHVASAMWRETFLARCLINDIRSVVYAPEYPEQIHNLVWEMERCKSALSSVTDVYTYLDSLDFKLCKRDCMIALSLRTIYSHVDHESSVWKSAVKRAYKELLSRGLDPERHLRGMVIKVKDKN